LAGTCLTGAAGVASSATIIEGIAPAPSDFSNTSLGFLLPAGTTQVDGAVTIGADNDDWFQFQNLLPLSPFSFSGGSLTPNYFDWAA
jgi:hypothetical protein